MSKETAAMRAATLVAQSAVAALGTLHEGEPSVTMVPYALARDAAPFVLLTSGLASHTKDMLAHSHVGLMVVEPEHVGASPHTLARVSIRGLATALAAGSRSHERAEAAYRQRFADMAQLFELGDFRLFAIEPRAVRVVLGFAQATSLEPETFTTALHTVR
jgi:putative heme iron utilization protein